MDPAIPKPTAKMTSQSWSSARDGLSVSFAIGLTGVLLCQTSGYGPEADALLAAPDRSTWTGRRDRLLLLLMVTTGVRVSELTALTALTRADTCTDRHGAHIVVHGKGRKDLWGFRTRPYVFTWASTRPARIR